MNSTPGNRFSKALDYLKETRHIRAFKDILEGTNYQPSTISEIRSGRQMPNDDLLWVLQNKYRINTDWIVTGHGEMLIEPQTPAAGQIADNRGDLLDTLRKFEGLVNENEKQYNNPHDEQRIFDDIVDRHNQRFDNSGLSKTEKRAYRHVYTSTPPEKLMTYILSTLDKLG